MRAATTEVARAPRAAPLRRDRGRGRVRRVAEPPRRVGEERGCARRGHRREGKRRAACAFVRIAARVPGDADLELSARVERLQLRVADRPIGEARPGDGADLGAHTEIRGMETVRDRGPMKRPADADVASEPCAALRRPVVHDERFRLCPKKRAADIELALVGARAHRRRTRLERDDAQARLGELGRDNATGGTEAHDAYVRVVGPRAALRHEPCVPSCRRRRLS